MYNVIDPQVEGHDVSRVGLADVSRYRLDHVVGLGPGEVLAKSWRAQAYLSGGRSSSSSNHGLLWEPGITRRAPVFARTG